MRAVRVVIENTRHRVVYRLVGLNTEARVYDALAIWLRSAVASVGNAGPCKSFIVGVHVDGADCDHGVQ